MTTASRLVVLAMVGGAIAAAPTVTHAQGSSPWGTDGDYYFTASVGSANASASASALEQGLALDGFAATATLDDTDTGWRLVGGWQFHDSLALEVGYVNLGRIQYSVDTTTADPDGFVAALANRQPLMSSGVTVGLAATMPIPGISEGSPYFIARLGAYIWESEETFTGGTTPVRRSDDGTDFVFGLGAGFQVSENVDVELTWERFGSDTKVSFLNVGARYRF